MAQVVSRQDALDMAYSATEGKIPKSHLFKLLTAKGPDGKSLRYFYSAPTRGFGGKGALALIDHGDFDRRLLAAVRAEPYVKKGIDLTQINPPADPEFAEKRFD